MIKRLFPNFEFTVLLVPLSPIQWFVPRFRENVLKEIDFSTEVTNMETCRSFFAPSPSIYIPRVYRDLSSHRICVMEFIHGIKVSNVSALHAAGIDTRHVASLCVEAFAEMIFQAPFLHVDPHAGNLLVRRDAAGVPQLVLLDHGMYNYPQPGFAAFMQDLWLAMVSQDEKRVRELWRTVRNGAVRTAADAGADGPVAVQSEQVGERRRVRGRFGEEMSSELQASIEDRVANTLEMITAEVFSDRIGMVGGGEE